MRVLVLNGSPKEKSDTFRLTEAFLQGFDPEGIHRIDLIRVIDEEIAPCRGCFGCWQQGEGHCLIPDGQNRILDLYRQADIILWSFPLYCYGMPSHLKAVLDRTIPLVKMKMVQKEDGTVQHEPLVDFSRVRTVVICGCGFPHWEGNFDGLRAQCKAAFRDPITVCVPETPLLNVPAAAPAAEPLLARFRAAGAEFAATLALSPATVAELERPMIPAADYIRGVNGG
jgi:hypothetical protein